MLISKVKKVMKKQIIKLLSIVLAVLLLLSGCGAGNTVAVNETSSQIEESAASEKPVTTETNVSEEIETSENTETSEEEATEEFSGIYYGTCYLDKIAFETYGVGETLEDYVIYTDAAGNEVESGHEGLYYTLNNVEVYEDFNSSGRDANGKLLNDVPMFDWNNFIVIELTAEYKAPEGGPEELVVDEPFLGSYVDQRMEEDFFKRMDARNHFPYRSWLSLADESWRSGGQNALRGFKIKDGESLTFEVGLSVGDEFLENENVYLETHWIDNKIKGVVHKYFDLFGCETTDWSMTKAEYDFEKGEASTIDKEVLNETVMVNIANELEPAVVMGVGDTLPMFLRYKHENEEDYRCIGTEGVYLTLDNVSLYDNFFKSGLTFEDLSPFEQEYISSARDETDAAYKEKESFSTNKFVILDLTAKYIAPEGAPETVTVITNNLVAHNYIGDEYDFLYDNLVTWEDCWPGVYYHSEGYGEDGISSVTISNGEKVSFRIGIKLSEKFIDANNVFLGTNGHNPQIEDFVYYLFEIFPK